MKKASIAPMHAYMPSEEEIPQERPQDEEGWPMIRRDAACTGSDGTIVRAPLEKVWEFKADGDIKSSPALAYGLVFFGSKDKNVYAVDAATGQRKWIFKTRKAVTVSPVVADGIVYFASEDKNLYAIDAKTGEKRWQFSTGNDISSTPAVGHGLVFFGCKDKHIYAIDAKTGERKWAFESGYKNHTAPTIAEGKVLISGKGFTSRALYAINATSGELVWKQENYQADPCPIAIGKTVLAYEGNDPKKRLFKIDLTNGAKQGHLLDSEASSATTSGGIIFVSLKKSPFPWPGNGGLYAFRPPGESKASSIIWSLHYAVNLSGMTYTLEWAATEWGRVSAPAVGSEFVFITKLGGNELYGISISRFMKRWKFHIKERIKSYPVISGGMVFVVSHKGKIHAFRGTKDPHATSTLHVTGEITKKPTFTAKLYHPQVIWPQYCCLCCGPPQTSTSTSVTTQKIVHIFENIPYCLMCINKVTKSKGGNKIFRGEDPGVELVTQTTLQFRNEKYWAMFMEANGIR